jgi:superfamily II DNA or RNA helicase
MGELSMTLPALRPWQVEAMSRWNQSGHHGCFQVATGGGKTIFALAARESFAESGDFRTLIIVPTTALLDQWFIEITEDAGISPDDVKVLSGADLALDRPVSLAVINTARNLDGTDDDTSDVLQIVDECHRAGSPENSRALLKLTAGTIGLSATPFRDFDDGFEQYIAPRLGPVLFEYTLADAIADGVLAGLNLSYVRIPLLDSEQADYDRLTGRIVALLNDPAEKEHLEAVLRARARLYNNAFYRIPVMRRIMATRRGKRAIVFVESVAAANQAEEDLRADGHSVTVYHSKMSTHLRRSNLRLFRKGAFDVLVACRALDEGFNVPEAEVAVIVAGTASRRQRIQRVGRVLRSMENKTHGEVITLYATPVEEARLLDEASTLGLNSQTRWIEAIHE